MPTDLELGVHTVMASGHAQDGTDRAVAGGVQVQAKHTDLPSTGTGSTGLLIALGTALIGLGLLLVVRRPQLPATRRSA